MPAKKTQYRKKSTTSSRSARFGARKYNYRPRPNSKIVTGPVPNSRLVRFRFSLNGGDVHSLDSTSGSLEVLRYRANSCYDPYYEVGGHQPYGFDQWMAFFRNGVVLGSKITVVFMHPNNDTANRPMRVSLLTSRDVTAPAGTDGTKQITEDPRAQSKILTAEGGKVTVNAYFSARKNAGAKDPVDEDDLHFGVGGDCSRVYIYHVCAQGLSGQTETCLFTGHIDYICRLFNPLVLTPS